MFFGAIKLHYLSTKHLKFYLFYLTMVLKGDISMQSDNPSNTPPSQNKSTFKMMGDFASDNSKLLLVGAGVAVAGLGIWRLRRGSLSVSSSGLSYKTNQPSSATITNSTSRTGGAKAVGHTTKIDNVHVEKDLDAIETKEARRSNSPKGP